MDTSTSDLCTALWASLQRSRYPIPEDKRLALLPKATPEPRVLPSVLPSSMGRERVKDFFHRKVLTKCIPEELQVFLRNMDGAQAQLQA